MSAKSPVLFVFALLLAACAVDMERPTSFRITTLVPGGPINAPNGITMGPDGMLYAGSVAAQTIYRINPATARVEVVVRAPAGEADDVAFAPNGAMVWTALLGGEIRARYPDGNISTLVSGKMLINPVDLTRDGRLFAAQMGFDRLYEFPLGEAPRLVASKIGNLNSFEISAAGELYGPLSDRGSVARIDIDTGAVTIIAENLGQPVAVNLDSRGNIWAVDWAGGRLWRIDRAGDGFAAPRVAATLTPPLDNLAIDADDAIYISRPAHSAIDRFDPATGEVTTLIPGQLASPGGLAVFARDGRETLLVADGYGYRFVDPRTGAVTTDYDLTEFGFPAASTDAAADDNYFLFSNTGARPRVYLVDRASGETVQNWTGFNAPYGVLLDANSQPLAADFGAGTIVRLERDDRNVRAIIASGLAGPVDLAWAGADAIYVSEYTAGRLSRIDIGTGARTTVAESLLQPEGIAVLPGGRIALAETGNQRLLSIDPATDSWRAIASILPIGASRAGGVEPVGLLSGVAVGKDGHVYLSADRDNSILAIR